MSRPTRTMLVTCLLAAAATVFIGIPEAQADGYYGYHGGYSGYCVPRPVYHYSYRHLPSYRTHHYYAVPRHYVHRRYHYRAARHDRIYRYGYRYCY